MFGLMGILSNYMPVFQPPKKKDDCVYCRNYALKKTFGYHVKVKVIGTRMDVFVNGKSRCGKKLSGTVTSGWNARVYAPDKWHAAANAQVWGIKYRPIT